MEVKLTRGSVRPNRRPQSLKRGDLVAEEVKRWIAQHGLQAGDRLPKEDELRVMFAVSKGTIREALNSLAVQGLITIRTGPSGGARIAEVGLGRTFQLLQNYLYFKPVTIENIFALRRVLEPELAAGAVPHLTGAHFTALERSIETCSPRPKNRSQALVQRQEDLNFHDILAEVNQNPLLRCVCQLLNQMLRHLVTIGVDPSHRMYVRFGGANVVAHKAILAAARKGDANKVKRLMLDHIVEAEANVQQLQGVLRHRFVMDSDIRMSILPRPAPDD